jgi:HTH-type transcriptional regulator/antitoxin HigA
MTIKMTDAEYRTALARVEVLVALDPAPDTPEGFELFKLAVACDVYERSRWPFPQPTQTEKVLGAFRKHKGMEP